MAINTLTIVHPISMVRTTVDAFIKKCEQDTKHSMVYEHYLSNVANLFYYRLSFYTLTVKQTQAITSAFNCYFGMPTTTDRSEIANLAIAANADAALALYGR